MIRFFTPAFALLLSGSLLTTSLLTACTGQQNAQHQGITKTASLAPQQLTNTNLHLDVTKSTSPVQPDHMYIHTGLAHMYFTQDRFVSDLTEFGVASFGGNYQLLPSDANKLKFVSNSENAMMPQMAPVITTELNFADKHSGTFTSDVTDKGNLIYHYEGTFTLDNEPRQLLPKEIRNANYHLHISNPIKQDPNLSLSNEITATFGNDHKVALDKLKASSTDFVLKPTSEHDIKIEGTLQENGLPYHVILHYIGLMHGTFSIDLGNGRTVAEGNFFADKFLPLEYVPLTGKLIKDKDITSKITKVKYPYTVYLPASYQQGKKKYPVIYVTDGQWHKDFAYVLEQKAKEVIMVAVDQGPDDRRMTDYRLPGANDYSKFLKGELIPMIEKQYRTNGERTFYGASLGGLLGSVLLSQEPVGTPYFKNYLLIDGSFWGVTPDVIAAEETRYKSSNKLPVNLMLSYTRQGNIISTNIYEQRLRSRNYEGINITSKEYKLSHPEMGPPSFVDFIDLIY